MSADDDKAEIERLRRENESLKATLSKGIHMKVSNIISTERQYLDKPRCSFQDWVKPEGSALPEERCRQVCDITRILCGDRFTAKRVGRSPVELGKPKYLSCYRSQVGLGTSNSLRVLNVKI